MSWRQLPLPCPCYTFCLACFGRSSTFALARISGNQVVALFRPQMGAATIAMLTGASLWFLFHRGQIGLQEHVLGAGAILAVIAISIQGVTHVRGRTVAVGAGEPETGSHREVALGQRLAGACLAMTVACMAASRYV